jgi:hypothetical protein
MPTTSLEDYLLEQEVLETAQQHQDDCDMVNNAAEILVTEVFPDTEYDQDKEEP